MMNEDEVAKYSLLLEEEKNIFHHVLRPENVRLTFEERQVHFVRTCAAIKNIIQLKLFRSKYISVENYFRKRWEVSRAQAYRLMDCHILLKSLKGFTIMPHRIRLCQFIKKLVGYENPAASEFWGNLLKETGGDEMKISTFNFGTQIKSMEREKERQRIENPQSDMKMNEIDKEYEGERGTKRTIQLAKTKSVI
ncbi:hypothetical protein BC833DRAFT_594300 [Globomyces pollinis-pini]|nr:hypothetical protein BC833DRAFT_594300 [Globomyces pollinis-pini]